MNKKSAELDREERWTETTIAPGVKGQERVCWTRQGPLTWAENRVIAGQEVGIAVGTLSDLCGVDACERDGQEP